MAEFAVKTGYGYFKDAGGNIVSKAELPVGDHPIQTGFTYTEVPDKTALDAVVVYRPPLTQQQIDEQKIQTEIRITAIEALKSKDELPADYVD